LTTAETAVAAIPSHVHISMGMALGEPPALLSALADRVTAGELSDLHVWYFHSLPHAGSSIFRYELLDRVKPHCMFLGEIERALMARGEEDGRRVIDFVPVAFSESSRLLSEQVDIDTFVVTVSPMDQHGWFTFGASNDYATTVARSARRLIVEVNANMPRVFGDSLLHVSEVDAIVEHNAPLLESPVHEVSRTDAAIGRLIADLIPDGACLQMGIGALPSSVCASLTDRKNLGIHTELLTPGLADLIASGAVNNRLKATYPGRSVFTFALGDRKLYDLLDDNPAINSLPVQVINDPRHIAKNDNVVSVNATLQIDLTGACNSEHMLGRQYSGAGGQLDFVRGARASRGGKSIIACHSTARGGVLSRIVPALTGPVTTPRNDTHIVVTEFGWADLRGKSAAERARAIIALADPAFREDLSRAARQQTLI
ncbi:acetyl-CoA hydrolase/transferase C-terminal domain-containing protein, partial [Phenylobacterium sp.]|uniref:acetyl-CoA hydrolase/transferase family protein n=1 Tax=Phenylobacterium sp. TaxID=1871053 RepID=UPI00286B05DE